MVIWNKFETVKKRLNRIKREKLRILKKFMLRQVVKINIYLKNVNYQKTINLKKMVKHKTFIAIC